MYKLGYGIVAFRDVLWSMFWIFAFFSVLAFYQVQIYKSGTFDSISIRDILPANAKGMLGNLGYSSVACEIRPL